MNGPRSDLTDKKSLMFSIIEVQQCNNFMYRGRNMIFWYLDHFRAERFFRFPKKASSGGDKRSVL